jgi:hypothetical protein
MLPKSAMAVPLSEPAPPPKTCTSLTLSRSVTPKWISNPPLGCILKALRQNSARRADSSGSIRSRMRGGTRISFLWGFRLVDLESEPDTLPEGSFLVRLVGVTLRRVRLTGVTLLQRVGVLLRGFLSTNGPGREIGTTTGGVTSRVGHFVADDSLSADKLDPEETSLPMEGGWFSWSRILHCLYELGFSLFRLIWLARGMLRARNWTFVLWRSRAG